MNSLRAHSHSRLGFTLVEMMISSTALVVVMGALTSGVISMRRSLAVAENYPLAKMHLPDFIAMDLRRAIAVEPNPDANTLLRLTTRNIYNADGSKMDPVRTKITTEVTTTGSSIKGKMKGNPHKYQKITFEESWGTPKTVLYTLSNGTVFRQVDDKAPVAIANGVQSVTFDPIIWDLNDPNGFTLTTRLRFAKHFLNKVDAPTGSVVIESSTFLRGVVYDD